MEVCVCGGGGFKVDTAVNWQLASLQERRTPPWRGRTLSLVGGRMKRWMNEGMEGES